jgi:hypothetical protein
MSAPEVEMPARRILPGFANALIVDLEMRYESRVASDISGKGKADARALVRRLIPVGETLPAKLGDEIRALGAVATPLLLEIVQDESLHPYDAPGEGWAPVNAVDLLGELRAVEAIEPLLAILRKSSCDEVLHGEILTVLGTMGQAALEPVLKAYAENDDRDFRFGLASVLPELKVKDERIFSILVAELEEAPGIAVSVGQYGDPRALPLLIRAFDELELERDEGSFANRDLVELRAAIHELGGALNDRQKAKYERGLKSMERWRERQKLTRTVPVMARNKLGRNEPCHCGSGKKYKKCCLTKDENDRSAGAGG